MRVLFTTLGSPSHGRAQLPLARALAAAGCEVLAATTAPVAEVFEQDDVRVTSCISGFNPGSHATPSQLSEITDRTDLHPEQRRALFLRVMSQALSGPMARDGLDAVLPVVRDFRPELILRDGMDLGSVLIGEMLGIPQLPTPSGALNAFDPAELLPGLNILREEHGLPAHEDPLSIVPRGRIDYVPPAYSFARYLPVSRSYRQTVTVDRRSVLPRWVVDLPTDRPLVFAAIGTALPMIHEKTVDQEAGKPPFLMPDPVDTLRSIIEAAIRLDDCTVLVATMGLPVDIDPLPSHIHITERLPQPLLLESVDLFLTHGGFNSVRESLRTATPMAVLPQFGDQHGNAQRVEELGLGREIIDNTPDGIATVCRQVLADPVIGANSRRARLATLTLPEIESAVTDLENLVAAS
ncbi:glycosyltransferase [Streptomyces sp. NPDC059076]|uniref:glycosyltransferase n=1 Tax=unclassified Streptomyces TaxID=2593676 RepID=UPI0036AB32AF